jgi:hypothetical protein
VRKCENQSELNRFLSAMEMDALFCRRAVLVGGTALSFSKKGVFGGFDCLCHPFLVIDCGNYRMHGACCAKQKKTAARQTGQTE